MLGLLILFEDEVEYCLAANRSGDVFVSVSSCSVGLLVGLLEFNFRCWHPARYVAWSAPT